MLQLPRRVLLQLTIFAVIAVGVVAVTYLHFAKLPATLFGVGRYTVTVQLRESGGLYDTGNVTYRGSEVGRVQSVRLTDTGVEAVLSLKSGIDIPSSLRAEVHSHTAIGETYIELLPRNATAPPLKDGDVIALTDTSVPPNINALLSAANTALAAIPRENLRTVVDESYTAVGGLGPELSRLVAGSATLAIDARNNLDPLLALVDHTPVVLDSQSRSAAAITEWASHLATVTRQLQNHDVAVGGVVDRGGPALAELRQLVERVQPALPTLLANLTSVGQVALTYQNDIEQLLVVFPMAIAAEQAGILANLNTKQPYRGQYLSFNLNLNLPPPCTTGFLPAQQQRVPTFQDAPDRPPGDLYCRVPQDSPLNVRGARNIPCETVPGKRAPTVKLCESAESFIPLNGGNNWKGDPNATLSGQDIPQLPPPATPLMPAPITVTQYDPGSGTFVGLDGQPYPPTDPTGTEPGDKTWQSILLPTGR
ncbi:MCE family protein [Mycobacterium vicinigordonae]|uniref:MCE family protein n=1 Tax=Mycobacterium vicinigordonae TaxID=1719132 RepID=A0A7D6HVG4_9MYCO|nr:MlaD family protein [Mycobacterium vicinigordonae]QLL05275.1 MCE family protein [Mycobacterium vicinigordonae]